MSVLERGFPASKARLVLRETLKKDAELPPFDFEKARKADPFDLDSNFIDGVESQNGLGYILHENLLLLDIFLENPNQGKNDAKNVLKKRIAYLLDHYESSHDLPTKAAQVRDVHNLVLSVLSFTDDTEDVFDLNTTDMIDEDVREPFLDVLRDLHSPPYFSPRGCFVTATMCNSEHAPRVSLDHEITRDFTLEDRGPYEGFHEALSEFGEKLNKIEKKSELGDAVVGSSEAITSAAKQLLDRFIAAKRVVNEYVVEKGEFGVLFDRYFASTLKPMLLDGECHEGVSASQMPVWVFDAVFWGLDEDIYPQFVNHVIGKRRLPEHSQILDKWMDLSGGTSIYTLLEEGSILNSNEIGNVLGAYLQTMFRFRGAHGASAAQVLEGNRDGTGGFSPSDLDFLRNKTKEAFKQNTRHF